MLSCRQCGSRLFYRYRTLLENYEFLVYFDWLLMCGLVWMCCELLLLLLVRLRYGLMFWLIFSSPFLLLMSFMSSYYSADVSIIKFKLCSFWFVVFGFFVDFYTSYCYLSLTSFESIPQNRLRCGACMSILMENHICSHRPWYLYIDRWALLSACTKTLRNTIITILEK